MVHLRRSRLLRESERGTALLIALMAICLTMGIGSALMLGAAVESRLTRNFGAGAGVLYAAEAAAEQAIRDLQAMPDWNPALNGIAVSSFADGAAGAVRTLADGQRLDPGAIVSMANCRQTAPCADAAMNAITADRPWGANNPRWQLFAWGPIERLLPASGSPFYAVVMIGDDASENDGEPMRDGSIPCVQDRASECNHGTGVVALHVEAFGPFGAREVIELTVARDGSGRREGDYNDGIDRPGVRIVSWREVR
jgi:hypothetical protein